MLDDKERNILRFAIASRFVVTILAIATHALIDPFDTSTHLLFKSSHLRFLQAFASWDGVHFLHIAQNGYSYEHSHAFFPLYPLAVRSLSAIPIYLSSAFDQDTHRTFPEIYVACGWIISNAAFVMAAVFLYRLGKLIFEGAKARNQYAERIARTGAYLFCISPSSIFMSSLYSESTMCLFSFAGFYCIEKHKQKTKEQLQTNRPVDQTYLWVCAILFGCASVTRSNGILLSLYLAWYRLSATPLCTNFGRFCRYWILTALMLLIAVGPQLAYFSYGIWNYCPSFHVIFDQRRKTDHALHDRPWCDSALLNYSAMYMFIQKEYWNVGLFRYYQWKQLPNFLLASPAVSLSILALYRFFRRQLFISTFWTSRMNVYCIHWAFLLLNGLLVVHVQVITRLLCACPPLYWIPAILFIDSKKSQEWFIRRSFFNGVIGYFILYTLFGSILFSSFYPWT